MRRQTQQLRRQKLPNNYDSKNINSHFTKDTKTIKPMTGLINHVNTGDTNIIITDGTSTRNRESEISKLFLVSESENFNRISDSENNSLEFVCLQVKLQSKNIGT